MCGNIWRYTDKQDNIKNMYGNLKNYNTCVWNYKEIQGICMETSGNIRNMYGNMKEHKNIYRPIKKSRERVRKYEEM